MQKYLLFAFCMIFIFFTFTSAWALFYDFSNKAQLDDWTVIGGKWKIEQGALSGEDAPGAAGFDHGPGILIGNDDWTDYTLEFKMKMADVATTCASGPIMRYVDDQNWYFFECYNERVFIRPHVNGVDLGKDPIPGTIAEGLKGFPKDGQWYTINIKAEGVTFTISVDGKEKVSFDYGKKEDGLDHGKVGFTTWPGDHVLYDDVSIVGPGIQGAAVSSLGKIATKWGIIKKKY